MLTGIHILLTYKCTFECDHCFLYSGPAAQGTFTLPQVRGLLEESRKIGSIEWIYFEGGEPFLYYPSLLEGVRLSRDMGFKTGIVTNAYGAVSDEDAELWLRPLAQLGIDCLTVSDDAFHNDGEEDSPARLALAAARRLQIPTSPSCIQKPFVEAEPGAGQEKGRPVIGGGAMFKGRAVEKLSAGLPLRPWRELAQCPHEDLESPSRVHVDPQGNVHLCQGLSMGNMRKKPLSALVRGYDVKAHPIAGPLAEGGPALLAKRFDVDHEEQYVDECHFCFLVRRALTGRFPDLLAPRQVYGLEELEQKRRAP
ncbi:MAG: radical SAM protein [Pseudomonadota bacterium]